MKLPQNLIGVINLNRNAVGLWSVFHYQNRVLNGDGPNLHPSVTPLAH